MPTEDARPALIEAIKAARWPDGSLDGFPSTKVAAMIADAILSSPKLSVDALLSDEREAEVDGRNA